MTLRPGGRAGPPGRVRYDAILAAGPAEESLRDRLAPGGRLVTAVGAPITEQLVLVTRGPTGEMRSRTVPVDLTARAAEPRVRSRGTLTPPPPSERSPGARAGAPSDALAQR